MIKWATVKQYKKFKIINSLNKWGVLPNIEEKNSSNWQPNHLTNNNKTMTKNQPLPPLAYY